MMVAFELGKFEHEVLQLCPKEFARILAFLKIRTHETKKQQDAAQAKSRTRNKRGR